MSPLPSSLSAPISSSTTRLSVRLATWNAIRAGRLDLIRPGDDIDRRLLRGQDQVDADGSALLGQANDVLLDFFAGRHHQVGHFVGDDDDERQVQGDGVAFLVVSGSQPLHQLFFAQLVVATDCRTPARASSA